MPRICGIDPGSASPSGAVYQQPKGAKGAIIHAFDIPMIGEENERRVDVIGFVRIIQDYGVTHCVIERVNAMPSIPDPKTGERRVMGTASMFRFATAYGDLRTTVRLCGFEPRFVMPAQWKKFYSIKGPNKEHSRQLAIDLWPQMADMLARKKDEGRAEAMLIARYGAHILARDDDEIEE